MDLKRTGFEENKGAAEIGGGIAGDARKRIESETGKPVVSNKNFLPKKEQDNIEDGRDET